MKTENKSNNSKEKKEILFYDRALHERSLGEMRILIRTAEYLSREWNSAGNLQPLNGELFRRWIAHPNLIFEMFESEANRKIDTDYWPGAHMQQENRFKLTLADPEKVNRMLKSYSNPEFKPGDLFSSTAWIDFDVDGRPYLSDEIQTKIREKCTVYAEPVLKENLKNIETMVASINKFKSFGRERTGRDVSLNDFPGLRMNGNELQTDTAGFIKAFYFENDPDYRTRIVIGMGTGSQSSGQAGRKNLTIPSGFKLNQEGD